MIMVIIASNSLINALKCLCYIIGDCCDHACKRQKLDGHQQSKDFDPCQLVKDSVSDLDDISMPSAFSLMGEEAYEFATHVVKVKRSGHISNVSSLWEMDGTYTNYTNWFLESK